MNSSRPDKAAHLPEPPTRLRASSVDRGAPQTTPPNLLRAVLEQRGWLSWAVFDVHFMSTARQVSPTGQPRVSSSLTSYKRWLSGENLPRGEAAVVLEAMLGVEIELLFRPAPVRDAPVPRPLHLSSRAEALTLDTRYTNSTLFPTSPTAGVDGLWRLDGRELFEGTTVAVQMYEAVALPDDVVAILSEDYPHLRNFVRPLRRGLLLGSLGAGLSEGPFLLDAAYARRHLAVDQPVEMLPIPTAYRVDDLTFAIVWALTLLDDGLSADDSVLHTEEQGLEQYLSKPLSAGPRSLAPDLSQVGAAWLGSRFCSEHALRQLGCGGEPGALWNREQTGEEASMRLFFRHQHHFIVEARQRLAGESGTVGSAHCIPEAVVKDSPSYERILLFLAIAWMEMHGLVAWVCSEPEYSQMDGLVLVPGRQAVISNWLRTPDIWFADVTDRKSRIRAYSQAVDHARMHSVIEGATAPERLHALADYLELDWSWLARRCRELGGYGTVDMLRPRSRLLTLTELDRVLDFVGGFSAA